MKTAGIGKNAVGVRRSDALLHWLRFNAVGGLGIGVQLSALFMLKSGLHLDYLLATGLAVEAAVLHNFLWHERYTWASRVRPSWHDSPIRLLRFNLSNGAISLAGNLISMKVIVSLSHVHYLVANGLAIAVCSLLNFLVCESWVFAIGAFPASENEIISRSASHESRAADPMPARETNQRRDFLALERD